MRISDWSSDVCSSDLRGSPRMSDQPPFDWDEGDASRRRVGGRHFATSDDPDVPVDDDDDDDVAEPYDDSGYDDFDDDYGDDYLDSYDDDDEYVEVRHA